MKKLLLLLILSFFSAQSYAASCPDGNEPEKTVSDDGSYFVYKCGLSVLDAPKAEFYQRQYDMDSEVDQILSNRKTINPFLAWNPTKLGEGNYYGISWSGHERKPLPKKNLLEFNEVYWNYIYVGKQWSQWRNSFKQNTFTSNIDWDHDAEYGVTKAMNIIDPEYTSAFAEEVHVGFADGFHGVILDWWHTNHPTPWRGTTLENVMKNMTNEIRKKSGNEFLIIGNTNWRKNSNLVSSLNGVFSELYKTPYSRSDSFSFAEIAEMEELIKFNEKHLRYPKLIAFEPWRITDQSDSYNRTSEENIRFSRLYSAMATVIPEHGYILYADNNPDFEDGDHDHYYYDVYSVDLGKPVSKYTPIAQGVAYKKFEDGYIAFNRLEYDVTVNFGDFQSAIPSMDAVFLNKDGTPYVKKEEVEEVEIHKGIYNVEQITKTFKTAIVSTSDDDPKVSKVIEVIQGDKFIVDIAEPHELAGSNIKLLLLDIDAPNATKSCPKELEHGLKVKDFVSQKLKGASSIKLTNFRKTNTSVIANVIVDGTDLGEELIAKGYADSDYGVWQAYFCSAHSAERFAKKYEVFYPNLNKHIFWRERCITLDSDNVERNARATYTLSQLYLEAGDINKSLDYLKQAATWGWLEPLEELGELLLYGQNYFGINIPINTIEGKKLLKKAHDKGSKSAELIYCSSLTENQQKTCKF